MAAGRRANSGLLEVQTSFGSYGSVCEMNAEAANVACKQIGYDFGVLSPSPCAKYGGLSWCGAAGSPVAMKNLKCSGAELSVDECSSEEVDDSCLSHSSDAIVFCGMTSLKAFSDGELRLVGGAGASQCRSARSARSDMLRALAPLRVWFEARCRELVADANSLQVCRKAFPRAHGAKRFGG